VKNIAAENFITGPEVIAEAVKVLNVVAQKSSSEFALNLESHEFGGCAIDSTGESLPASTLKACQEADAILMGKKDLVDPYYEKEF
jgi:3-isopropylmalate dehydrogenase